MVANHHLSTVLDLTAPHLWGALHIPADTMASSWWADWCSILAGIEDHDGDIDLTVDDLYPLAECWRALKRRGVVFDFRIESAMSNLWRDMIGGAA